MWFWSCAWACKTLNGPCGLAIVSGCSLAGLLEPGDTELRIAGVGLTLFSGFRICSIFRYAGTSVGIACSIF